MANIAKQQERIALIEQAIFDTSHKISRETYFLLELIRQCDIEKEILSEMLIPSDTSTDNNSQR